MIACLHCESLERIRGCFELLYGAETAARCTKRLVSVVGRYGVGHQDRLPQRRIGAADIVLITYADAVSAPDAPPLAVLRRVLKARVGDAVNTVHLLPFYPWTTDDGFSVMDYRAVDARYGGWDDLRALGNDYRLMADLVLNHASAKGEWFKDFQNGISPGRHYFITSAPDEDWSNVVRPRTTPLLQTVHTKTGEQQVWSTFGGDQMDLNFRNPDLLFEFIDILFYYLSNGIDILRLDAIAYLWKASGTDCIHRPETHAVVKLLRELLNMVAPGARLLTETNVPHDENISYFGQGDEAHWVYQFPLPPLLLHAMHRQDATLLTDWAAALPPAPRNCAYLNFTASHDGIGVRPLQGLVPDKELEWLAERVTARGGRVSRKSNADGTESPYELNITYLDALSHLDGKNGRAGDRRRFLTSQAVMLALQGVPAVFYHSLFGTRNDLNGVAQSGMARRINRRKFTEKALNQRLDNSRRETHRIYTAYHAMLELRAAQPAFALEADQAILALHPACFAIRRRSMQPAQTLYCLSNFSAKTLVLDCRQALAPLRDADACRELFSNAAPPIGPDGLILEPWQTLWIEAG